MCDGVKDSLGVVRAPFALLPRRSRSYFPCHISPAQRGQPGPPAPGDHEGSPLRAVLQMFYPSDITRFRCSSMVQFASGPMKTVDSRSSTMAGPSTLAPGSRL